jgi:hypothetical protein
MSDIIYLLEKVFKLDSYELERIAKIINRSYKAKYGKDFKAKESNE